MNKTYQFLYLDHPKTSCSHSDGVEFEDEGDSDVIESAKLHVSQEFLSGDVLVVELANGGGVKRIVARVKRGQPQTTYTAEVEKY